MLKPMDASEGLAISFELSDNDRSQLMVLISQESFNILQRLMEAEVKALNVRLINTDPADTSAILANHHVAKAAGMFYTGFIQRLQEQIDIKRDKESGIGTMANPEVSDAPDFN